MDLSLAVRLLISEPSKKQDVFPFQREICLFRFQTWIYFPRPLHSKMVNASNILAAARFFELRREKIIPMNRRADLSGLRSCLTMLNMEDYSKQLFVEKAAG